MTTEKYKIVLVTSDRCGHCTTFKKNILSDLQKKVFEDKRLEWIHINLPDFKFPEQGYPDGMKSIILWFPILFLIPKDVWDSRNLKNSFDRINIFNAVYDNRSKRFDIAPPEKRNSTSLEGIMAWLNSCLGPKKTTIVEKPAEKKIKFRDRIFS